MVIELTNRCNLACGHCFDERHAATGVLALDIIDRVVTEGRQCDISHLSFTGGEPTLHPNFPEIVERVRAAGYTFSLVSNGSTFPRFYSLFMQSGNSFRGATFSLDGAREETHDRLRGTGSFRQVMRASSICFSRNLPFTFNMVVTAQNQTEIEESVDLACQLGSRGLRFGHLMPTPETALRRLDLTPEERREVENRIWKLRETSRVPIGMAPGYHSEAAFFPCGPLELEEFNVDYSGNLTLCCQLSGYSDASREDVIANLRETNLSAAFGLFRKRVESYISEKRERVRRGSFTALDHFPCWYCVRYLGKTSGWSRIAGHPWLDSEYSVTGGKKDGPSPSTSASG
jgi:MoaA/NifB/PqqE/SkfB family radical SAM enzyme